MEHFRSRSRNAASMEVFKFPRSPKPFPPPPPIPAVVPSRSHNYEPAVRFDYSRRQSAQVSRRSWLSGLRPTRVLFCLALGAVVWYLARGGDAAPPAPPAVIVQEIVRTPPEPGRFAKKVRIGSPINDALDEKRGLPSESQAWVLSGPPSRLPKCEKILLYTFKPSTEFSSEYLLYLTAASLATKLGYTLFEDDSQWNFGRLTNYFRPRKVSCTPPGSWSNPKKAFSMAQTGWQDHPRIRFSSSISSSLDDWVRKTYLGDGSSEGVMLLRELLDISREVRTDMLAEDESLPEAFEGVFQDVSRQAEAMWRLELGLEEEVAGLKTTVGLAEASWLEPRELGVKGAAKVAEKGERKAWHREKRALEVEGRGPFVGVHAAIAGKAIDFARTSAEIGISNTFGNMTVLAKAADDVYRRLLSTSSSPLSADDATRGFSPQAQPTLLLMTANPDDLPRLSSEPLASPFRFISPPPPHIPSLGKDAAKKLSGFNHRAFDQLPLVERVAHTRAFVRDLTLLVKEADAMIVSAASSAGRLAMLLGGSEAVLGPRSTGGEALGGRIRSVDAFWRPTVHMAAIWQKVFDAGFDKDAALDDLTGRGQIKGERKKQRIAEEWLPYKPKPH